MYLKLECLGNNLYRVEGRETKKGRIIKLIDAKNIIFYPLMAASVCWCILSLFKMKNFIEFLKVEYP